MSKESNQKAIVYSALEVANICGVVNQTAINWIRSGHLKAFNTPGGQYRVYADNLAHFMKERGMRIPDSLFDAAALQVNKTILIVDDDQGLNEVIKKYLTKQFPDFTILQSYDGFDAGSQAAEKRPGFIILDLGLPGINGTDICRRLEESDTFGYPYIIIITVEDDPAVKEKLTSIGADLFLQKPISLIELSNAIHAKMQLHI